MTFQKAKIALVFDWMTNQGGAERVNLVLHQMFPEAPIFTSIFNPGKITGFANAEIHTSFIQHLPLAKSYHQMYLGLMPQAYELFDLSAYDIVISSSHSCAKGVITKPETLHICYCHTPMRYAWDNWHSYIREYKMNHLFKYFGKKRIHRLRIWDRLSADRVDHFIANSCTTQKRIEKYYNRPSTIIHPMIESSKYKIAKKRDKYFLAVGRLTAYKKFDLIVEAFNQLKLPLKVAGTGTMENSLRKMAHDNVEILGFTDERELIKLYSECEALIFPQVEDFGIIPLEAMACGRPVIALNQGGALDTMVDGKTGIFFEKQNVAQLKNAVEEYLKKKSHFRPDELRKHARLFDRSHFEKKIIHLLEEKWSLWQQGGN